METTEPMESPGKYLKTKRESQKLSLEQVAHATRIREVILKAIEEDKYEDLPDLYVRSFLSAYAGCLGLDPNEVILLHEKCLKNLPPSRGQVPKHLPDSGKRRANARLLVIVISALLLAALLVFVSFKLLPRVLHSLRTEESKLSSSSSVPSPAMQKEAEPPTADQPVRNEIQPMDTRTDKEP
jgi:cytoskeletal protein RodZ